MEALIAAGATLLWIITALLCLGVFIAAGAFLFIGMKARDAMRQHRKAFGRG